MRKEIAFADVAYLKARRRGLGRVVAAKIRSDLCELGEGGLEVFDDFGGDDV